jgi:hypothetical protein
MGIEKVTTHPLKYKYMEMMEELIDTQYPNGLPHKCNRGEFCLEFELLNAYDQRRTAQIIATAFSGKAEYHRDKDWQSIYNKGYYEAAGWTISGNQVMTANFLESDMDDILVGLSALKRANYCPDGEVSISIAKDVCLNYMPQIIMGLESRRHDLESMLQLNEEIRIIVDSTLAVSLPMYEFDMAKIANATSFISTTLNAHMAKTVCNKE